MKLLITVAWDPTHLDALRSEFPGVRFVTALTAEDVLREVRDAEVVFGHLRRDSLAAARRLRWVQCQGAGVEELAAIPELVASDVAVTNTRGAHAATIAEHVMGMLVFLARGFRTIEDANRRKEWLRPLGYDPVGLSGLTMGIIGYGRIGAAIGRRAQTFEMDVIAVDAHDVPREEWVSAFWLLDGLDELLRLSDVVAVTAPLTPSTRNLLDARRLSLMRPGAYLLAVSRGGIIDEAVLAGMLREGKLAGAGLDVQAQKPVPPESPLWDVPNLLITPHCAGQSQQTTAAATDVLRRNLRRYLTGEPLENPVDLRLGY